MHKVNAALVVPILTTDHPVCQCVDLEATFGNKRYRYSRDPAYEAETPAGRRREAEWLTRIECKHGWIAPQGGQLLMACCDAGPVKRRELERLRCVESMHPSGKGCIAVMVLFDVADIEAVAEVLQPRKRPVYSPEEKARRQARLDAVRPGPKRTKSTDRSGLPGGQKAHEDDEAA